MYRKPYMIKAETYFLIVYELYNHKIKVSLNQPNFLKSLVNFTFLLSKHHYTGLQK